MDFTGGLVTQISDLTPPSGDGADWSQDLLQWIAGSGLLKLSIEEREIRLHEKYFRFSVRAETDAGTVFTGYGRSALRGTAAAIAVNEVLERWVARTLLKDSSLRARFSVSVEDGGIHAADAETPAVFPSSGLRSSNGWAVHFSAQKAIENAAREALERHILLLSYLKYGWSGFLFDEPVPFSGVNLVPGIASVDVGGFKAGLVLTTGDKAPGMTFGYLCAEESEFEQSKRWLGAFFESFEQWESLDPAHAASELSVIESYQWHYFKKARPELSGLPADGSSFPSITGSLAVIDLQRVLQSPFPLYAAFVYGGDFLPLFLRQRLSEEEISSVELKLRQFDMNIKLPEFHPIL